MLSETPVSLLAHSHQHTVEEGGGKREEERGGKEEREGKQDGKEVGGRR